MSRLTKIGRLPKEVRAEIDARLSSDGAHAFPGLLDWLQCEGHAINEANLRDRLRWLKKQTPELDRVRQQLAAADLSTNLPNDQLTRLLFDLAVLHLRERVLLAKIIGSAKA